LKSKILHNYCKVESQKLRWISELVNIELRMHLASMYSPKYLAPVDSWLDYYLGYIYTISPCLAFSLSYVFILLTYWRKQGWARLKVKVPYARIIVVFLCEYLPNYFVFFPSLSHFNSINQFGMVYPHSISNPPISTPIQLQEYIWFRTLLLNKLRANPYQIEYQHWVHCKSQND
jgi:hypothetical protein